MIDKFLLEILCCPLGKLPLRIEGNSLICVKCNTTFPQKDCILSLIIEEAKLPDGINSISELYCQKENKM